MHTAKKYFNIEANILLLLFLPGLLFAQPKIELSSGFYTFSMKDMKSIQSQIHSEDEIGLEPVYKFPPYWAYNANLIFAEQFTNGFFSYTGIEVDYTSTGGRLSYSDYSGHYYFDQIFKRFSAGGFYRIENVFGQRYSLGTEIGVSFFASETIFESYLALSGNLIDNTNINFSSFGVNGKALLLQKFRLLKSLYLINKVGFQLDIYESKLTLKSDPNAYLNNPQGNPAKTMWSGLRGTLGLGININQ